MLQNNRTIFLLVPILIFCLNSEILAQVHNNSEISTSINTTGNAPDPSAILDVQSTDKGVLVPRMTKTERDAIISPAKGLMIYQTTIPEGFYFNSGTPSNPDWKTFYENHWENDANGIHSVEDRVGINIDAISTSRLYVQTPIGQDMAPGNQTINGYKGGDSGSPGLNTAWTLSGSSATVVGHHDYGNYYSTGVLGLNYHDFGNSAAVAGVSSNGNNVAGFLSYRDTTATGAAGDFWSGYFTDNVKIDGTLNLSNLTGTTSRPLEVDPDGNVVVGTGGGGSAVKIKTFATHKFVSPDEDFDYYSTFFAYVSNNTTSTQIYMPIELPNGAEIQNIKISFLDNSAQNYSISLFRRDMANTVFDTIESENTNIQSPDSQILTIPSSHIVDNENYWYWISIVPSFGNTWDNQLVGFGGISFEYIEP